MPVLMQPPGWAVAKAEEEHDPGTDWPAIHAKAWELVAEEEAGD